MRKNRVVRLVLGCVAALAVSTSWAGGTPFTIQLKGVTAASGGGYSWDYNVHSYYNSYSVQSFLIPELHAGDLAANPATPLPKGWSATEYLAGNTSALGYATLPSIYSGAAANAFLFVTFDGAAVGAQPIGYAGEDFVLLSQFDGTTNASFQLKYSYNDSSYLYTIDPPVPLSTASVGVPEPTDLALLAVGGVGLVALRRRKQR